MKLSPLTAAILTAWLTAPPTAPGDTLHLRNGHSVTCELLGSTTSSLRIRYLGKEIRTVPLKDIDHVAFSQLPGEPEATQLAITTSNPTPLTSFWIRHQPWLAIPQSRAGQLGLVYASLLASHPSPDRLHRALAIYLQIESSDWNPETKAHASAGRLRILLHQGKIRELRSAAASLTETSSRFPRAIIEIHHILAEAAAAELLALTSTHPRWQLDDALSSQHQQLLAAATDGFLFAHLFHGSHEDLAARGLWSASRLAATHGMLPAATAWASDVTRFYPSSPEKTAAAAFLASQPPPTHPQLPETTGRP
jgi:hypothetical protein